MVSTFKHYNFFIVWKTLTLVVNKAWEKEIYSEIFKKKNITFLS